MRGINIFIPNEKKDLVLTVLESLALEYRTISDQENTMIVLTVPASVAETVIDALEKVGVGTLYGFLQVYSVEFSAGLRKIQEASGPPRASREEILQDIMNMSRLDRNFITYTTLASILAAISLLTDNILMLVASMIIAPVMGPILGISLGTVLNVRDLQAQGFKSEAVGLGLCVLMGFIVGLVVPYTIMTDSIYIRAHPTMIDFVFAIVAGIAAALSVVSVVSIALVGVAIAASVVPPAVNIGIGIAYLVKGDPAAVQIISGSTILLTVNILAINAMSIIFFWLTGIRPGVSERRKRLAKETDKKQLIAISLALVVVLVPLACATIESYRVMVMERSAERDIREYVSRRYSNIRLVDVDVSYVYRSNKFYVALKIAVRSMEDIPTTLPEEIRLLLKKKYGASAEVYMYVAIFSGS